MCRGKRNEEGGGEKLVKKEEGEEGKENWERGEGNNEERGEQKSTKEIKR